MSAKRVKKRIGAKHQNLTAAKFAGIPVKNELAIRPHGLRIFVPFCVSGLHCVPRSDKLIVCDARTQSIGHKKTSITHHCGSNPTDLPLQLVCTPTIDVNAMVLVVIVQLIVHQQRPSDGLVDGERHGALPHLVLLRDHAYIPAGPPTIVVVDLFLEHLGEIRDISGWGHTKRCDTHAGRRGTHVVR